MKAMALARTVQSAPATTQHIAVGGTTAAYTDTGSGEPVLLVHCSSGSRRQWRHAVERLAPRFRVLAPDLCAHGETPPPWGPLDYRVDDDVALVTSLAIHAGRPVHLVGHSYGGMLAMAAAVQLGTRVASLTLIEPALFHLLPAAGETEAWSEIAGLARTHTALCAQGRTEDAAEAFMGYWTAPGAWTAMPAERRAAVVRTMPYVAEVWHTMFREAAGPTMPYESLTAPVLLLRGTATTRGAAATTAVAHRVLPGARLVEVPGAGHMLPLTHAEAVTGAIEAHLHWTHGRITPARPIASSAA